MNGRQKNRSRGLEEVGKEKGPDEGKDVRPGHHGTAAEER
jgi:hypothetical protein